MAYRDRAVGARSVVRCRTRPRRVKEVKDGHMISTILLVFAFVLTLISAFLPVWRFPHLGWLGVSLWILSVLLGITGVR